MILMNLNLGGEKGLKRLSL